MNGFEFQYNPANFQASVLNISGMNTESVFTIGGIILGIVITLFLYKLCLYIYGYHLVRADSRLRLAKKNTIQELILMKTIQDELEREIEDSLLSSAFTKQPTPQAG